MNRVTGTVGAIWGVVGVVLLLGSAVYRLAVLAHEAFSLSWMTRHWVLFVAVILGMAYAEGYRGFQLAFAPRVAARARYLRDHPALARLIFAPLFCMGYFHATRRRQITSVTLTIGIIGLVLLVRLLAQPWRGIIDAGVVVGLAWGIASVVWFAARALTTEEFPYLPEVPAGQP